VGGKIEAEVRVVNNYRFAEEFRDSLHGDCFWVWYEDDVSRGWQENFGDAMVNVEEDVEILPVVVVASVDPGGNDRRLDYILKMVRRVTGDDRVLVAQYVCEGDSVCRK